MQRYNVQHRNMKRYNVQHCSMKRYNVPPRAVQRRRERLSTDDNVHRDEATAARMQMCQECVSRVRPGADMGARWRGCLDALPEPFEVLLELLAHGSAF